MKIASQTQKDIYGKIKSDSYMNFFKPTFHFSCPAGWCNDPNGFSYFNNKIHLFYQWHPYSTVWGPMHWGHSSTTDFINWKMEEPALCPDTDADMEGCFSGSAINYNDKHLICYTGVSRIQNQVLQNQCIAIGDGTVYEKIKSNPVVTSKNIPFEYEHQDFRDPKIFVKDNRLFMICVLKKSDKTGAMVLFENTEQDLRKWRFLKTIAESTNGKTKMWECPDYFELDKKDIIIFSPQEMQEDFEKGFHKGNNSVYMIGDFDFQKINFIPSTLKNNLTYEQIDYGIDFYAPQTCLTPDNRRIMIAWMQSWESPVTPKDFLWTGMMTFPRELKIINNHLFQNPVKEIFSLRKSKKKFEIESGLSQKMDVEDGRHFDMEFIVPSETNIQQDSYFKIKIGNEKFIVLYFDNEKNILNFDRTNSIDGGGKINHRNVKINSKNKQIKFRILVDINSIEVFVNDGETAFSNVFFIPQNCTNLFFENYIGKKIEIDFYQL